jgi:hypothetical protein
MFGLDMSNKISKFKKKILRAKQYSKLYLRVGYFYDLRGEWVVTDWWTMVILLHTHILILSVLIEEEEEEEKAVSQLVSVCVWCCESPSFLINNHNFAFSSLHSSRSFVNLLLVAIIICALPLAPHLSLPPTRMQPCPWPDTDPCAPISLLCNNY